MGVTGIDLRIAFFAYALDLVGYCIPARWVTFVRGYNNVMSIGKVITYFLKNSFKLVAGVVHNSLLDHFENTYGRRK